MQSNSALHLFHWCRALRSGNTVSSLFMITVFFTGYSIKTISKHEQFQKPLKAPICLKVLVNVVFARDSPFGMLMGVDAQLPGFCK